MALTEKDLSILEQRGISPEELNDQLRMLREGFPYLKIYSAAKPRAGIRVLTDNERRAAGAEWDTWLAEGGTVMKMVPASGAASRMFKNLFEFVNGSSSTPDNEFIEKFCDEIEKFAFFDRLNKTCVDLYGLSVADMFATGRHREVVAALILPDGMNYGQLPKAVLDFHKQPGRARTALEEHLAEGAQYARQADGSVRIHFTVSDEHRDLMNRKIEEVRGLREHAAGVKYNIDMSVQKPSTDTAAVTADGEVYREDGEIFFRPGGHGALIENLNELDADVIFIKNIDNVVPDGYRASTIEWKRVLGGLLVSLKAKADDLVRRLRVGDAAASDEALRFLREELGVTNDRADVMSAEEMREYLLRKLDRPMRVCGMVRNEGEPGGGPFLVYFADGTISPQILESVQINTYEPEERKKLSESTHFNPVDLVCATRDCDGKPYNLTDYVDRTTGFISRKSRKGVEIKALERPGLWNGSMSDWNTVFVEVPSDTFNPVKTVNDLLRPAHQP